jgi:signal transduction histidine kinase
LDDLSLLLDVAQAVSATLDLERGVLPILNGALEETGATVARFILLSTSGNRVQRVFSSGKEDVEIANIAALDRDFSKALRRRRHRLVIQDLSETKGPASMAQPLQSVAVFPVRLHNDTVAIFWVGADQSDAFDEARVNFLSTLANQAAVLVENARLFQAAEGGRRRLAAILASTTDAILVIDSRARLLLINPAAQRVLEVNESAYGRLLKNVDIPEPLKTAVLRSDEEQQAVEVPLEDGRTFYASIAPILDPQGLMAGKVVVMRDVTHFKELDEMKSDFVATVSHDLRAPLTFIRGYATMLMMVGDLNDKQHDYLDRILEGIDQMSALIGDLLNLRRIEAGVGVRQEACRLGLILVEAVDTMRARATNKGVMLRLDPAEGAPTVIGDCTLIRQAVSNLVDNAIKYTPAGGQVNVGLDVTDSEAIIHISDTGIGIAPEDMVRLFEKFYRIKRRETSDVQGTGLGLALVKSIVERHGGRVWVDSEVDQGSTFYIALQLPDEEEKADDIEVEG